jgi:hypothetical protein
VYLSRSKRDQTPAEVIVAEEQHRHPHEHAHARHGRRLELSTDEA